jgi:hypothetical protein
MKNYYPYEKFYNAINSMATSPKSLQNRIFSAYIFNIIHVKVEDIPESAKAQFINIQDRLSSVKATSPEGDVAASVKDMSDEDAISIANDIFYVYDAIKSAYYD